MYFVIATHNHRYLPSSYQGVSSRWLLGTKDAHGLYRCYGFKNLTEPEKIMMRLNPNANQA
ncbi:hypothetical protein [Nostoc sp. 'Peltigera membranacea cyanobiont' 210A]|uniref:hypothetical protein n=1 Tax=Nostoc sp. 'Peltigera membranacea cyanobiont' 210A TaxID=2014529 RepID=UPI001CB8D7AB|nr:hypothetical protein [Nostoc sp. 'Peltigera membranacea cyanobiont' 210A]